VGFRNIRPVLKKLTVVARYGKFSRAPMPCSGPTVSLRLRGPTRTGCQLHVPCSLDVVLERAKLELELFCWLEETQARRGVGIFNGNGSCTHRAVSIAYHTGTPISYSTAGVGCVTTEKALHMVTCSKTEAVAVEDYTGVPRFSVHR